MKLIKFKNHGHLSKNANNAKTNQKRNFKVIIMQQAKQKKKKARGMKSNELKRNLIPL